MALMRNLSVLLIFAISGCTGASITTEPSVTSDPEPTASVVAAVDLRSSGLTQAEVALAQKKAQHEIDRLKAPVTSGFVELNTWEISHANCRYERTLHIVVYGDFFMLGHKNGLVLKAWGDRYSSGSGAHLIDLVIDSETGKSCGFGMSTKKSPVPKLKPRQVPLVLTGWDYED